MNVEIRNTKSTSCLKLRSAFPVLLTVIAAVLSALVLFFGENFAFISPLDKKTIWTILFSVVLLASLEEIIFRYFLLNFLWQKNNFLFAVATSACIFGFVHLNNGIGSAINATVLSIFLSFIYFEKKNIFQLIIIHSLYNLSLAWGKGYAIYLQMWHLPALEVKIATNPLLFTTVLVGNLAIIFLPWLGSFVYMYCYIKSDTFSHFSKK